MLMKGVAAEKMQKNGKSGLTDKQEAFAQSIAAGHSQSEAYRMAYNAKKMKDSTVHSKASALAANGKVRARVEELKALVLAQATKGTIASATDVLEEMTCIALGTKKYKGYTNGGEAYTKEPIVAERLRALENLGKYHGVFADGKKEADAGKPSGVVMIPPVLEVNESPQQPLAAEEKS